MTACSALNTLNFGRIALSQITSLVSVGRSTCLRSLQCAGRSSKFGGPFPTRVNATGNSLVRFMLLPSLMKVGAFRSFRHSRKLAAVRPTRRCHISPVVPLCRPPAADNRELNGGTELEVSWPLTLPADLVPGSERARVQVVGDLLGPSIDVSARCPAVSVGAHLAGV